MSIVPVVVSSTMNMCVCVCVLHIKPFFVPVDIQHNQCSCRFSNPRTDTSSVVTKWHCIVYSVYCLTMWYRSISVCVRGFLYEHRACISPGLNNRHGHWLCRMSTGRHSGLMFNPFRTTVVPFRGRTTQISNICLQNRTAVL